MDFFLSKQVEADRVDLEKKMHETIAKAALKYGHPGLKGYTDAQIDEFWTYDTPPPYRQMFQEKIKVKNIKKIIHSALRVEHSIWNSDFLHGLATNGTLIKKTDDMFQSLRWRNNEEMNKIVLASPFGGTIGKNLAVNNPKRYDIWSYVPAFDLAHTENTPSYVAGILSAGKIVLQDGHYFSKYDGATIDKIKKLHIPVEKEVKVKKFKGYAHHILISPFWGALFSKKMPKEVRDKWFGLKEAYNAHQYSAIMWRTYVDTRFRRAGIPYLKSRRMIFYEYKCEEGAMFQLEKLRFDLKLTQLDYAIRDIVKEWANNLQKSV